MRIAKVSIIPVAFPSPPLRNNWGMHPRSQSRALLRVESKTGIVGWAETWGGPAFEARVQRAAPSVIGQDPRHLDRIRLRVGPPAYMPFGDQKCASAFDVACLDLWGRAENASVGDILGGRFREEVEFAAYLFYHPDYDGLDAMTPEGLVDTARRLVDRHGFRALKLKGGVLEPELEVETLRQLRKAFPTAQLRIDPNGVWSVATTLSLARELETIGLEYLEDPVSGATAMATVRRRSGLRLATNMCVVGFGDIASAARLEAVDIVLGDIHFWGGLSGHKRLASVCEILGLGLSMHSATHLDLSLAAVAHAASIAPNQLHASDTHFPWTPYSVLKTPLAIREGRVRVPDGPGLGVEVDEDSVARMNDAYKELAARGMAERDDSAEIMRNDASWAPVSPRW